jgi:hypothetical protein
LFFWGELGGSAKEASEKLVQEDALDGAHFGELDAHTIAGNYVTNDSVGVDAASRNFEDQAQFGCDRWCVGCGDECAAEAESFDARHFGTVTAVPGYEHAFGERDALVATPDTRRFFGHEFRVAKEIKREQ